MPERPLLILPAPGEPARRGKKQGGTTRTHFPSPSRQVERLSPRLTALQETFEARRTSLRSDATGVAPEDVVVLETAGTVDDFIVAVRNVEGLEWLAEIEAEDLPPDDDFFVEDADGTAKPGKTIRGRLFLVFTNQQALRQLLSLWDAWKDGRPLPHGLSKWAELFSKLRDVRPWGVRDRLIETGVLDDWRDRVQHDQESIPCEVELWFRTDPRRRRVAGDRVAALIQQLNGRVLHEAAIDEIAYHALLARLPIGAVRTFLDEAGHDAALVQCEQIQFFRATGQMAGIVLEDGRSSDETGEVATPATLGEPVVALFDGLPLQNHRRLANHLVVDDPDGFEPQYPATERRHGTAMASLIVNGDLDAGAIPLGRQVYVRPILRPDPRDWRQPREETMPEDTLVLDLIHRSVRRLFEVEDDEPPVAPNVAVINLSIGIRDRPFDAALSPLARLLDWLAWKYRVLFVVSAGNHAHPLELSVPRGQLGTLSPADLQASVIAAVARDARNRRLLSPAEAMNVVTVGGIHSDSSTGTHIPSAFDPYLDGGLPSIVNAQGMGYRRAIKPEILSPGGRVVFRESLQQTTNVLLDPYLQSRPPGQRVAAPGSVAGDQGATWHTRGTSNAAALVSRAGSVLYDVLEELRDEPGGELIDEVPRAIWLKALLAHAASWGAAGSILESILKTPANSRQFKEYLTRLLGYGAIDLDRVHECTTRRVTALGGGVLQPDQAHIHRLPLPPSLGGVRGLRRLLITLAWFSPINTQHQAWRRADLWFEAPSDPLDVKRKEADWHAVRRGTLQHEILEGNRAAAFVDGDNVEIRVSCRADAGALEEAVPYALATTLEVGEEIGVDIYNEVLIRVRARVQVAPTP